MDRLDQLVTSQIADYLLVPDRVADLLAEIVNRRAMAGGEVRDRIERAKIERFGSLMRRNITTGDVPFGKAYLRSFIDAVEVDDRVIRIHGSKSTLEQAVIASSESGKNGVRSFVRKWRAVQNKTTNSCKKRTRRLHQIRVSKRLRSAHQGWTCDKPRSVAIRRTPFDSRAAAPLPPSAFRLAATALQRSHRLPSPAPPPPPPAFQPTP